MTVATTHPSSAAATPELGRLVGLLGEFTTVDDVMAAATRCRDLGFRHWDVHSPFPIHGIDRAMGNKMTILPWIVLLCGLTGMATGLALTIFTMASDFGIPSPWGPIRGYPFMISGKPLVSLPAFIPVIFELTILFSAFGAVFGMFLLNRLPLLYNPKFKVPAFARATADRFFVAIDARDEQFDANKTAALLRELGAVSVAEVRD
jgi:hypothetical protein